MGDIVSLADRKKGVPFPIWAKGDCVILASGGPVMTIMEIGEGDYLCAWPTLNDDGMLAVEGDRFPQAVLLEISAVPQPSETV